MIKYPDNVDALKFNTLKLISDEQSIFCHSQKYFV